MNTLWITGFGLLALAAIVWQSWRERDMVRSGDPYPVLYPSREIAWRTHELTGEVNDGNCYRVLGVVVPRHPGDEPPGRVHRRRG